MSFNEQLQTTTLLSLTDNGQTRVSPIYVGIYNIWIYIYNI